MNIRRNRPTTSTTTSTPAAGTTTTTTTTATTTTTTTTMDVACKLERARSTGRLRRRVAAVLTGTIATVGIVSSMGASPAGALTPAQSSSVGSVNTLYGSMDGFWRYNMTTWGWGGYYRTPTVRFFNTTTYACGTWLNPNNAWACSGAYKGQIWYGSNWAQRYHNAYGDYGSGVILAHEWGHEIQYYLNWGSRSGNVGSELFADCLAGMYTRYGVSVGKLNNADVWEGWHTLRSLAGPTHGTAQQRGDWFMWGYNSYNINSCASALR